MRAVRAGDFGELQQAVNAGRESSIDGGRVHARLHLAKFRRDLPTGANADDPEAWATCSMRARPVVDRIALRVVGTV